MDLVAPVMLVALVATQTFGGDEKIVLDARIPGVAAAAVAIWRGAPVVAAMVVAALVTALVRVKSTETRLKASAAAAKRPPSGISRDRNPRERISVLR